jgi:hypothetical protein
VGRQQCIDFEEVLYLKQEEIQRARKVTTSVEEWPLTHDRLRAWVLAFRQHTRIMFGETFIIMPLLNSLLLAMQEELLWHTIETQGCMTLAWTIHKGIRMALFPNQNLRVLRKVVSDFEDGVVPTLENVGPVIAARIRSTLGASSATRAQTTTSIGKTDAPAPARNGGKRQRSGKNFDYGEPAYGPEFARAWETEVRAVKDMVGPAFKGGHFCKEQSKIDGIFGSEFIALMPTENPQPCMSFFILGRCHDKCQRSHKTVRPPDQDLLNGLKSRIQSQCHQLLQAKKA